MTKSRYGFLMDDITLRAAIASVGGSGTPRFRRRSPPPVINRKQTAHDVMGAVSAAAAKRARKNAKRLRDHGGA